MHAAGVQARTRTDPSQTLPRTVTEAPESSPIVLVSAWLFYGLASLGAVYPLTHLPRNDIPSGILSSNVAFLRATYFIPAVCDDRANQFFEKPCIRPMRPENARIRLPAGLASPELGCTGSCRDRAGLNHRSLKSLTQTAIWSWWNKKNNNK